MGSCGFDKGDCTICTPGCEAGMRGNGVCDRVCNVEECEGDVGDCYGVCWSAEKLDYMSEPFFFPHCRTEWKGDGYCDCFCMNEACNFDFGDCKGYDCSGETETLIFALSTSCCAFSGIRIIKGVKRTDERYRIPISLIKCFSHGIS